VTFVEKQPGKAERGASRIDANATSGRSWAFMGWHLKIFAKNA
jgi:hypothetical protein